MSQRKLREQAERNRIERSWALFENREKWRSMIPLYQSLGAAQLFKLRRDYPEAYAWFQRNA